MNRPRPDLLETWRRRRGDFAADADVSRSTTARFVWSLLGALAFALGFVGAFLPILPTTPFMILAAACWARSSARFYNWMLSNRVFGPVIYTWRETRTIPRRAKRIAIALIIVTIGVSVAFVIPVLVGKVVTAAVGVAVIVWLWRVPSEVP